MINSKGVVIFAYNSTFNYVEIAEVCAALVRKQYFGSSPIPVTLITDEFGALLQTESPFFHKIIVHTQTGANKRAFKLGHDSNIEVVDWKNLSRADAYDLSPYDQTLLLDCDYLMFNTNLLSLFDTGIDFTCFKDVLDLTGNDTFKSDDRLSKFSIPMLWATAIYFTKCEFSKAVFDMMKTVRDNYAYYAKVYNFSPGTYRNDFALSIAHHALSGYGTDKLLSHKMATLSSTTDVVEFRPSGQLLYQYKVPGYHKIDKMHTGWIKHTDVHVMNKNVFEYEFMMGLLMYATC